MIPNLRTLGGALVAMALAGGPAAASGQQAPASLSVVVASQGQPLAGVQVSSDGKVVIADARGTATLRLSAGNRRVVVWDLGYAADTLSLHLRAGEDTTVHVALRPVAQQLAPIVVRATRIETRIEREPERVEVMAPEDVHEKTLTSPGDMTNLLVEMGGIRVQALAAGLGGASIRMQGLRGAYTLLLVDGLPLHGEGAPAFSLVQAPPLDLAQVEVIKGAATALYGPSALGGVVDLISKTPDDARQVVLNQTSQDGTDGLLWLSRPLSKRWGYTALAGVHRQGEEDADRDGWADIAGHTRVEARPRLFWRGRGGSSLRLTVGGTWEQRQGGTLPGHTVASGNPFPEKLDTRHLDAGSTGRFVIGRGWVLGVRGSATGTWHDRTFGAWLEHDRLRTLFGEATVGLTRSRHAFVAGVAAEHDGLRTRPLSAPDYGFTTLSMFASDTYTPVAPVSVALSARMDHHDRYGTFVSPRASLLLRLGDAWSVRASAARGVQAPRPTADPAAGFANYVAGMPLRMEHGTSTSLDVDGTLGPFQLNATLFRAFVDHPVLPRPIAGDSTHYSLVNASGPMRSAGAELFAVYARDPFLVTATYSHTAATEYSPEVGTRIDVPLTPRNAGGADVAWGDDEPGESGLRAALEVFYTGRQRLEEDPYRTFTPGFTTVEILVSKRFGGLTVYVNGDDLTNVRQTHWDPLLRTTPGLGGVWATEQWAPLRGRTVNFGARVSF
ncbi:MAG: TonB-dependent receptor [Gemmatimonadota bacterium]